MILARFSVGAMRLLIIQAVILRERGYAHVQGHPYRLFPGYLARERVIPLTAIYGVYRVRLNVALLGDGSQPELMGTWQDP